MDLRDIVRAHPKMVVGHRPFEESLNIRKEIQRFGPNPLSRLLEAIDDSSVAFFRGDIGRYLQGFSWYVLSLRRTLTQSSVARRCDSEIRYHPTTQRYSQRQKQLAAKRSEIGAFLELDYQNLIVHSCILLDRTIALARRFLSGPKLPSFTSFSKHKAFLAKNPNGLDSGHREYATRIAKDTDWFDIPLKVLRDKFLIHSAEKHMSFFGWSGLMKWDLEMLTMIPASTGQEKLLEKVKVITFIPRRLARDMEAFLTWFSKYGEEHLRKHPTTESGATSRKRDVLKCLGDTGRF